MKFFYNSLHPFYDCQLSIIIKLLQLFCPLFFKNQKDHFQLNLNLFIWNLYFSTLFLFTYFLFFLFLRKDSLFCFTKDVLTNTS